MKRIIEIKKEGHLYYIAQYKFLFWWRTYQIENKLYFTSNRKFSSIQDAINFIRSDENNKKKSKPKVVWQSN